MNKLWSDRAWDDYLFWQMNDKKTLKKINDLVKDIERNGLQNGTGHPEPLRYRKAWSRRIDHANIISMNKAIFGLYHAKDTMKINRYFGTANRRSLLYTFY